jgi:hypothetical protein
MTAHRKQRRRVIDHLQAFRIAGFADGDERNAKLLRGFDLTLDRFARTNLRRSSAAAPRQLGQGLERRAGAAEMIDEGAKRARPDVLAADEAEPVEPLLVGEMDVVHRLVHVCPQASLASVARMTASTRAEGCSYQPCSFANSVKKPPTTGMKTTAARIAQKNCKKSAAYTLFTGLVAFAP